MPKLLIARARTSSRCKICHIRILYIGCNYITCNLTLFSGPLTFPPPGVRAGRWVTLGTRLLVTELYGGPYDPMRGLFPKANYIEPPFQTRLCPLSRIRIWPVYTPQSLLTHLSDFVHYDDTNPTHQQDFVDRGPRFKERKQNYKSVQS